MFNLRSWFSILIALFAVVLVGCSGPAKVAIPTTYSDVQIQKIQQYVPKILSATERMANLEKEISERDWQEAQAIMRGPLGEMLQEMKYLSINLLPQDQKNAQAVTRSLFEDFIGVDAAAANNDVSEALREFDSALRDIDQFLGIIPQSALETADTVAES
jgi:photosystem II protein PsbQ